MFIERLKSTYLGVVNLGRFKIIDRKYLHSKDFGPKLAHHKNERMGFKIEMSRKRCEYSEKSVPLLADRNETGDVTFYVIEKVLK